MNQIGKCLQRLSYGNICAIAQEGHNEHGGSALVRAIDSVCSSFQDGRFSSIHFLLIDSQVSLSTTNKARKSSGIYWVCTLGCTKEWSNELF